LGLAVFSSLVFVFSAAQAQDAAINLLAADAAAIQAVAESAALAGEAEKLEGVALTEPTNIPSGFGFWWNDLKENVSLALTFDPVKKAEKQLQFAAQRVKLAEYMAQNSTDAKVQEKAQQLLERANEYTQKIQERENALIEKSGAKTQILFANMAKFQTNAQAAMEKLEDKLPAEKLEAFQQWSQQVEARQQQFLVDLKDNPNMPQGVKDKAAEVQARIEMKLQDRQEFRAEQQEILQEAKINNADAQAALEELRNERGRALEEAKELYKENKEQIINKINSGQTSAVRELIQLNQAAKTEVKNIQQETKAKAVQVKTEIRANAQQSRQELQQNRVEQRTENGPAKETPAGTIKPSANSIVKPTAAPTIKPAVNSAAKPLQTPSTGAASGN